MNGGETPVHPGRVARNEHFAQVLAVPVVLLGAVALVATLVGGRVGSAAAVTAVVVVVLAPLARVAWLAVRWWRRGDRRYASVALGVLGVVAVGALIAFGG